MEPEKQSNKPAGRYGKRPAWQWVLIYVIAAAVVYTIIYYVFIHKSGGSTGGSGGGLYGY